METDKDYTLLVGKLELDPNIRAAKNGSEVESSFLLVSEELEEDDPGPDGESGTLTVVTARRAILICSESISLLAAQAMHLGRWVAVWGRVQRRDGLGRISEILVRAGAGSLLCFEQARCPLRGEIRRSYVDSQLVLVLESTKAKYLVESIEDSNPQSGQVLKARERAWVYRSNVDLFDF